MVVGAALGRARGGAEAAVHRPDGGGGGGGIEGGRRGGDVGLLGDENEIGGGASRRFLMTRGGGEQWRETMAGREGSARKLEKGARSFGTARVRAQYEMVHADRHGVADRWASLLS